MGWFQRTTKKHGGFYSHQLARSAEVNGGGEEFGLLMRYTLPVQVYRGSGRTAQRAIDAVGRALLVAAPIGAPLGTPEMTDSAVLVGEDLTANPLQGQIGY